MPLVQTRGAASAQGFGEFAQVTAVNYIEDVYSTYLYAGNDSTQTITNNIDISTKGALVWVKGRSGTYGVFDHTLINTPISNTKAYSSNTTGDGFSLGSTAFTPTTTGFNLNTASAALNNNGTNYVSWTFRKQPKFFDIVTYTGNGTAGLTVSHNLGSVPGCIIVKSTTSVIDWAVFHTSLGPTQVLNLNLTGAAATSSLFWNNTAPTSTQFTVGDSGRVNGAGQTYVAYLFAHNAGGFGLTGTDNVISCGSFTSSGNYPQITLGYEPQWVLIKRTDSATDGYWMLADVMRPGFNANAALGNETTYILKPNTSEAETTGVIYAGPNATGFSGYFGGGSRSFIYIAIRRGPMKIPTVGTTVFAPNTATGNGVSNTLTTNFPVDLSIDKLTNAVGGTWFIDRLRGGTQYLTSTTTAAEGTYPTTLINFASNTSIINANNGSGVNNYVDWAFRRAPSFFDEVCYTGTGSVLSLTHNLTVAPEFILIKSRSDSSYWILGANFGASTYAYKNDWGYNNSSNTQSYSSTVGFNAQPNATTVSLSNNSALNVSASTYVMYMWATCAGVSKVGTYTGTGALQTINCGFTSGARFVLITRSGVVGDVNTFVYDSARGISSGNDPYSLLEATAAQVTGTNYVDTTAVGFQVTAAAPAGLNASGGTYIFLAIA